MKFPFVTVTLCVSASFIWWMNREPGYENLIVRHFMAPAKLKPCDYRSMSYILGNSSLTGLLTMLAVMIPVGSSVETRIGSITTLGLYLANALVVAIMSNLYVHKAHLGMSGIGAMVCVMFVIFGLMDGWRLMILAAVGLAAIAFYEFENIRDTGTGNHVAHLAGTAIGVVAMIFVGRESAVEKPKKNKEW